MSVSGTHTPCAASGPLSTATAARVIKTVVVPDDKLVTEKMKGFQPHQTPQEPGKNPLSAVSDAVQSFYASSVGAHVMATR